MKKYRLYNDVLGWLCFVVAAATYLLTVEPTASFWDCPEFISQGAKLEVGHPPGNPIFMLAARFFINFAGGDVTKYALMVNSMSALLSAGTILLLFWTITHLVKRLIVRYDATEISLTKMLVIFGSGICGALAYTWSDTFWFSAVEGEVYAFSSLCTALVFWLILKWENRADQPHSDRYLIFIAYIIGVSIAVHLLNLLCIPAIVLVIYYRKFRNTTATGSLIALAIAAAIVALILFGLVPGFIEVAQSFELFFVNTLGCSYNVGVLVYTVLFIAVSIWSIRTLYQQKSANAIRISFLLAVLLSGIPFIGSSIVVPLILLGALAFFLWGVKKLPVRILTIASLSILVIFAGYSSYALLLIRSHANPPMNQNAPDNVFSLGSYLSREQYGETPLLYGPAFTSTVMYTPSADGYSYDVVRTPAKDVYTKVVKTVDGQSDEYIATPGDTKYDLTPKMLFPRMYSSAGSHPVGYMEWIGASEDDLESVNAPQLVDRDGNVLQETVLKRPSFRQNLQYFFNYQVNYMYWRYFMWNFAGRQNDYAGEGQANRGNWISGIPIIDNARLGNQELLPDEYGKGNKGHNVFYMLPLLMGIIGLTWQAFCSKRGIEQFWVIFFFFFMTGLAIVLYLNQPPLQPRERDYAFAGSFYAFAIWIGMGVAGLWALLGWLLKNKKAADGKSAAEDAENDPIPDGGKKGLACAIACAVVALAIPLQMVSQTWDDHDRSGRYTTRDFGMNYLSSIAPNGIIFTNGDNDTFPLWYAQEVEGYRTDVRVVNLSYLTTDWYANQMRTATDGAAGIPTFAKPADYAYKRMQFCYFDSENQDSTFVDVFTSLDDLYHNPKAMFRGSRVMRYPNIAIPSNLDAAVKAGVISAKEAPAAEEFIGLTLADDPKNPVGGITLSQALSLDMIATQAKNGWNRPAYFAMTVPDEYYLSLSPYLRNTGLSYQVSPIVNPEGTNEPWIDTDKMYDNITTKFRWGGLDKLGKDGKIYLDETVRRMVTTHRSSMADLAMSLYREGAAANLAYPDSTAYAADRYRKAIDILNLIEDKLPTRVSPYSIQIGYQIADTYLLIATAITSLQEKASQAGADDGAKAGAGVQGLPDPKLLHDKGMQIVANEIARYGAYLPYFKELQRALPGSGFPGLSSADRYVPTYLFLLMQLYIEEGGDLEALQANLLKRGIDLNEVQLYLRDRA